jgi:hypothetical protein
VHLFTRARLEREIAAAGFDVERSYPAHVALVARARL